MILGNNTKMCGTDPALLFSCYENLFISFPILDPLKQLKQGL